MAVDVLARRSADRGEPIESFELSTITGDAATQHAVRRAVVREGEDRDELGREGFAARADRLEEDALDDLSQLLEVLRLQADLDRWSVTSDAAVRAARVAFVRLFEEGLLTRTDAVLDSCPVCETVVDSADIDSVETEVDTIRLNLPLRDGELQIDVTEPELILGAVAVAVPTQNVPLDDQVYVPLVDAEVPIVPVTGLAAPAFVIPGHYQWCYEVARQLDKPVVEVLDADGVVRLDGALNGLNRYAARSAATEQLLAEGFVVEQYSELQTTRRCHRCDSVLVALRGRHWILSFRSLTEPVANLVSGEAISFSPTDAADRLLEAASKSGAWVVSQQLWAGQPIPVYTCLDCGQTTVAVEMPDSCPSCMGTLEQDSDTLDARFIAAITPLAMLGWPNHFDAEDAANTALTVGRSGIDAWALPMAAFGLRLIHKIVFSRVLVHQYAIGVPEPGHRKTAEFVDQVGSIGTRIARAGLLLGDLDVDRAKETVAILDNPNDGTISVAQIVETYDDAIAGLDAGGALAIIVAAARDGIDAESKPLLAQLARPLLGE